MNRFLTIAFFAVAMSASGCCLLFPESCAVESVHAAYNAEFAAALAAPAESGSTLSQSTTFPGDAFPRTLTAIENYRKEYGADSVAAAHCDVLEGMILLQTGRVGQAKLQEERIAAAENKLSAATSGVTRDHLFAACFPHLVSGWTQIRNESVGNQITSRAALELAAEGIASKLPADATGGEGDSGALYLAHTAAIFWLKAWDVGRSQDDDEQTPPPYADPEVARKKKKEFAQLAASLMGRYLTSAKKAAASNASDASSLGRHLRWYAWFVQQS